MIDKKKKQLYQIFVTFMLCIIAAISLIPFIYLIITSCVNDMSLVFKNGIALKITSDMLDIGNYRLLFTDNNGMFFSWFKNSGIITILFTVLSIGFSSMVGYGVSMYKFKGKQLLVVLILSTMMIPVETLMIPLYNEIKSFNLLNTHLGVVLPFAVSAFTIYFFMQYAQSLSPEFMDAARIDENFTLTVGLQTYLSPYGNNYNLLFAGAVLSVIPVMIIFFACQKLFMEGMIAGGIKG